MISFLKMLFRVSYKFGLDIRKDLIVFDDEEKIECLRLFNDIKSKMYILPVRFYAVNNIYITPNILLRMIKFILLGNFNFSAYLCAIILEIKPKVVVTTADNSIQFSNTAKILKKENIKCISIQRAACDTIVFWPKKIIKRIFIPEFLCFGDYEKNLYRRVGAQVLRFTPVGSYHYSNFEYYYKKKIKIKYDLCLLAEFPYTKGKDGLERKDVELDRGFSITKFAYKFAKENRLSIVIAGKRPAGYSKIRDSRRLDGKKRPLKSDQKLEEEYYKKIAGKKIKIIKNIPKTYSSYKTAYSSKVIIAGSSTLLREMLGAGKKILSWRSYSDKDRNFPLDGIFSLQSRSYKDFEKRLKNILKMNIKTYSRKTNRNISYIMRYEKKNPAKEKILQIIKGYIND